MRDHTLLAATPSRMAKQQTVKSVSERTLGGAIAQVAIRSASLSDLGGMSLLGAGNGIKGTLLCRSNSSDALANRSRTSMSYRRDGSQRTSVASVGFSPFAAAHFAGPAEALFVLDCLTGRLWSAGDLKPA